MRRAVLGLGACAVTALAAAQGFPSRPIRVIVPTTAGGVPDVLARAVGQRMAESLGQPVVVENRAGAGGILAAEAVLKSPADGHTLFLGDTGNYAVSAALYAKFPYDVQRDFVPIVLAAAPPVYLVSNSYRSVDEFVRAAKAGAVTYGSTGNGNVTHLAMELLRSLTGASLTHVPYKGAAGLAPALLAGDVPVGFIGYSIIAPHAKTGRLRVLAVSTSQRSALTPDVPTVAEAGADSGLRGYGFDISVGYLAPAGTPRAVVQRLNGEINAALKLPEVRQVLETAGIPAVGGTPEAFGDAIRSEVALMAKVVKAAGAKVE